MNCIQRTLYTVTGEPMVAEKEFSFQREDSLPQHVENGVVNLYPQLQYQTIDGFGGAMTESAAWLLSKMDPGKRRDLMEYFFSKEGLDLRFLRVSLDSCDYSLSEYQAVEDPIEDPELATFSLKRDEQYVIPMIREALALNGDIQVMLSPWSPPACWKTPPTRVDGGEAVYGIMDKVKDDSPSRCNGGSLKPEFYGPWARYMVKYVLAYRAAGIPVTMLSVQNEEVAATNWDSCVWTALEEQTFIKDFLYPEMIRQGIADSVKLLVWDHNKERAVERTAVTLSDPGVREAVGGIAFHWYSGDHFEAVDILHQLYPEKLLVSTECCEFNVESLKDSFLTTLLGAPYRTAASWERKEGFHYARDILGNLNAGMHRWIDWNLILDCHGGPRHVEGGGFTATIVATEDGGYQKKLSACFVEQIIRAIRPGARRIGFSRYCSDFLMTAVCNPDGTLAVAVLNAGNADSCANIRVDGWIGKADFPAGTIGTLILK